MSAKMLVAVKDLAMNLYASPIIVPTQGVALRSFADEANNVGSPMNKHPQDYELWCLGYYSEVDGSVMQTVDGQDARRRIARASEVLIVAKEK